MGCDDPIFLAMKPRQFTIYRNPQSAHKWTVENFLWTKEKQTVNSLNHGVDYFFNLTDVRAFLEKQNKLRTEIIIDGEGRPAVGPTNDRVDMARRPSNIVIVESDTYTEYIDDSGDEYTGNLVLDDVLPINMSIRLLSSFDKNIQSDVCGSSTSALPGLQSLHISTEACSTWVTTCQPLDLKSSDSSRMDLQQDNFEVLETSGQKPSPCSWKKYREDEFSKAERDERAQKNEVEIEKLNEKINEEWVGKKNVEKICQKEDIFTEDGNAAGYTVKIDLNLIPDVEVEFEVLGTAAMSTQCSAVKESSSSTRVTNISIDDSDRLRAQEKLDLAYRRTAKRLSRGYVTHN